MSIIQYMNLNTINLLLSGEMRLEKEHIIPVLSGRTEY